MIEEQLERLHNLLGKQITNLDGNVLLDMDDQIKLAKIIERLTSSIENLQYALAVKDRDTGEKWKND